MQRHLVDSLIAIAKLIVCWSSIMIATVRGKCRSEALQRPMPAQGDVEAAVAKTAAAVS